MIISGGKCWVFKAIASALCAALGILHLVEYQFAWRSAIICIGACYLIGALLEWLRPEASAPRDLIEAGDLPSTMIV